MGLNYNYTELMTKYYPMTLIIAIIAIIAMWRLFEKANKPGWAAIVPFYNSYCLFEIAGMNGWMFLLLLIPIVNIVVYIILNAKLAQAFGKSSAFTIGLVLLNTIFMLILGFDDSKYVK
jgi:hypothetical protein